MIVTQETCHGCGRILSLARVLDIQDPEELIRYVVCCYHCARWTQIGTGAPAHTMTRYREWAAAKTANPGQWRTRAEWLQQYVINGH